MGPSHKSVKEKWTVRPSMKLYGAFSSVKWEDWEVRNDNSYPYTGLLFIILIRLDSRMQDWTVIAYDLQNNDLQVIFKPKRKIWCISSSKPTRFVMRLMHIRTIILAISLLHAKSIILPARSTFFCKVCITYNIHNTFKVYKVCKVDITARYALHAILKCLQSL